MGDETNEASTVRIRRLRRLVGLLCVCRCRDASVSVAWVWWMEDFCMVLAWMVMHGEIGAAGGDHARCL